jgi:polyhydroxybutyrate depolymerase
LPVLLIANEADPIVPFRGGDVRLFPGAPSRGRMISAEATIAAWAKRDGCAETPDVQRESDVDPGDGTKVRRESYSGCQSGTEVLLYVIEGGGHTWPGGTQYLPSMFIGKVGRDFNACDLIWAFFQRHTRE